MVRKKRVYECIEYLAADGEEELEMKEQKQSKHIRAFARSNYVKVVGSVRKGDLGELGVRQQWMKIGKLIFAKKLDGIIVSNMAAITPNIFERYVLVGIIKAAGGVVIDVDRGNLSLGLE